MAEYSTLEVDIENLHLEWQKHPGHYHKWAMKLADAKHDLDVAEAALEVTEAEIGRDIRMNPGNYGLTKPTKDAVEEAVILSAEYQKATHEVIELRHRVGAVQAKVNYLDHKKRSLESLVSLRINHYYSEELNPPKGEAGREFSRRVDTSSPIRKPKKRGEV